jgi:hypothetical protein
MLKQVKRSSGTGQTTATRPAELKQSYRQHRHTRHESENTHWHHSRAVTGDEKGRRLIVVLRDVCRATKHLAGVLLLFYLGRELAESILKERPISIVVFLAAMVGGVTLAEVVQVSTDVRRSRRS